MAATEVMNYHLRSGTGVGVSVYDQDFDFVELYIKYRNGEMDQVYEHNYAGAVNGANEDERKALQLHYISKLYSYKAKLIEFLDTLDFKTASSSVKYRIIGEYLMLGGKYVKGEANVVFSEAVSRLKSEVIPYLSDLIDDLNKNFSIRKIQQAFMLISLAFCMYSNSIELSKNPVNIYEKNRTSIKYDDKFCYLANDTGIFGLNTWLYGFFHGVHLIGVPSRYSNFDFSVDECPTKFEHHDYTHTYDIENYGKHHGLAYDLYIQILNDPEATILQKELLILCLWAQIHEVKPDSGNDFVKFFSVPHFFYRDVFVAPDFWEEYNRFRDLVLSQELLDQFHTEVGDYENNITPKSLTEFRDFIDNQSKDLDQRIQMLARLVFFYYREYCKKYYQGDYLN